MLIIKETTWPIEYSNMFCNNEGGCPIPLYHGTRRHALTATRQERELFYNACDVIMKFAQSLVKSNGFDNEKYHEYRVTKNRYFLDTMVYLYGSRKCQYGDFYVTSSLCGAISFAYNVGGELGQWAYSQCVGFRELGFELDEETKNAAIIVEEEYDKYAKSEKVVLVYGGVRLSDLTFEGDKSDLVDDERKMSLLKKGVDTDVVRMNANFILNNMDKYTANVITEKDFRSCILFLTMVTDVDELIAEHNLYFYPRFDF